MEKNYQDINAVSINRNYFNYGLNIADILIKAGKYEDAAQYLNNLASFAWFSTTGYYTSGKLEHQLNTLGEKIADPQKSTKNRTGNYKKSNVLHVASSLYEVGGHTQVLFNWIKLDDKHSHHIILTNQSIKDLPKKKIDVFGFEKSMFTTLNDSESLLKKALVLRNYAQDFDYIVLHIHPNDVIPSIAFATNNLPPVLFFNHADHLFWVGTSVIDILLQIRESNIELDKKRRKIEKQQLYLPIPILDFENPLGADNKYLTARKQLAIEHQEIVLLSTGNEYKFKPFGNHNLFEAIIPILNKHPEVVLYIAGIPNHSELAKKYNHKQIKFLGIVSTTELSTYEFACDIYIETMPCSSFTAMLQPVLKKKVIHLMHNPSKVIQVFPNIPPFEYSDSIEEWGEKLDDLILNSHKRTDLGNTQYTSLQNTYSSQIWKNTLDIVYEFADKTTHSFSSHREERYFEDEDTAFIHFLDSNYYINYGLHTHNLPFINKIKHILSYFLKEQPKNVKLRKRDILTMFFFNFKLYQLLMKKFKKYNKK